MCATGKEQHEPGPFPTYTHALVTVDCVQPRYPILTDETLDRLYPPVNIGGTMVRQEWRRFVQWAPNHGIETLSIEAGSMRYAEGGGVDEPTVNTAFNSPTSQTLAKGNLIGTWMTVPYRGLVSQTTLKPERIKAAIGTVNTVEFMGYAPGVLRFDGYRFIYGEAPYPEDFVNAGNLSGNQGEDQLWPSMTVDVELTWSIWDPPSKGTYFGHNLVPYRNTANTSGKWFLATTNGDPAGARIFTASDHRLIFLRSV